MSEDNPIAVFEQFYELVKRAYLVRDKQSKAQIKAIYSGRHTREQIQYGLTLYLQDKVSNAPLLDSSGIERVVSNLTHLMIALHHFGLGRIVGESMEYLEYEQKETLQAYFQQGIDEEEDPERQKQLIKAVRSVSETVL